MINIDCVRELIIAIDKNTVVKNNGIHRPIHMRDVLHYSELSEYDQTTIYEAAVYLVDKKLIELNVPSVGVRIYSIKRITAKGNDFLCAIKEPKIWNEFKKYFSKFSTAALSQMASEAIKFAITLGNF